MNAEFVTWLIACFFAINAALNRMFNQFEQANSSALVGICLGFLILVWNIRKLVNVLSRR